jgi:hypothetical protein
LRAEWAPPLIRAAVPAAVTLLLTLLVLKQAVWSAAAVAQPRELMYGEAVLYDHAARLLRGEALYQPLDRAPFSITIYTPLYYWVVAGLHAAVGPGFGPGRLLSSVAVLAAAALVGTLTAQRLRRPGPGLFAALLFLALGISGVEPFPWSALYKEDLLGVALSLGAVAALSGGTGRRRLALAASLAALAFLTKQTFVAAGLAGVLWLWRRDRQGAAVFAGAGLALALGVCGALQLATGAFLANAVAGNANPFSAEALQTNLALSLPLQGGPVALAGLYLIRRGRARPVEDLVVVYFWAAMLPLVGLAKVGSNYNYWIELAAVASVLATHGLWLDRPAPGPGRAAPPLEGAARAGVAGHPGPLALLPWLSLAAVVLLGISVGARSPRLWPGAAPADELQQVIERVRAEPREVLAVPLDVVVLADRPVLLEPYVFSIRYSLGLWDPRPLVQRICEGGVGLVVLDRPLESDIPPYHGHALWPEPVLRALRATLLLERRHAGRYLYVPGPRQGVAPACGAP